MMGPRGYRNRIEGKVMARRNNVCASEESNKSPACILENQLCGAPSYVTSYLFPSPGTTRIIKAFISTSFEKCHSRARIMHCGRLEHMRWELKEWQAVVGFPSLTEKSG
jgi:hypothetical protein